MAIAWKEFVDALLVNCVASNPSMRIPFLKQVEDVAHSVPANTLCETTFGAALSHALPEVTLAAPIEWGEASEADSLFCRSRLAILRRTTDGELHDVRTIARKACVLLNLGERAQAADALLWLETVACEVRGPLVGRFLNQAFRYLEASSAASPNRHVSYTLRLRRLVGMYD